MKQSDHIEKGHDAFAAQLLKFKNTIGQYAAVLELTPEQIAGQAADANYFNYSLHSQETMQHAAKSWTTWKTTLRTGGKATIDGEPAAPKLPEVMPPVAPGIETRFRALVRVIKAHRNYNPSIGIALGIESAELTAPDLTTLQPEIAVWVDGAHVFVDWGWQGNSVFLDLCELQVDRSDGQDFALLTYDTTPGYIDPAPLPAAPAKWIYRAIYRVGDERVGQWSNPVSIVVGG